MANSRLERIGTIYSRITGLLRSGALKPEDKPIWFDVYQHFPPKYAPKFERAAPTTPLQNIFYEEDKIRAKIHSEKTGFTGSVNLNDVSNPSNTQKCIAYYEEFRTLGEDEEGAFKKAMEKVISERSIRREKVAAGSTSGPTKSSIAEEFKKYQGVNVADIFKKDGT